MLDGVFYFSHKIKIFKTIIAQINAKNWYQFLKRHDDVEHEPTRFQLNETQVSIFLLLKHNASSCFSQTQIFNKKDNF